MSWQVQLGIGIAAWILASPFVGSLLGHWIHRRIR